eukprot:scaffold31556_cov62-Attheya_sp.AAC.4
MVVGGYGTGTGTIVAVLVVSWGHCKHHPHRYRSGTGIVIMGSLQASSPTAQQPSSKHLKNMQAISKIHELQRCKR